MEDPDAPWWGVPLLADGFLALGMFGLLWAKYGAALLSGLIANLLALLNWKLHQTHFTPFDVPYYIWHGTMLVFLIWAAWAWNDRRVKLGGARWKRRTVLSVILVVSLPFLTYLAWKHWPFGAISPYSYYQIKLGMTLEEAQTIVGLPPGTHRTRRPRGGMLSQGNWGNAVREEGNRPPEEKAEWFRFRQWWGEHYAIQIILDGNGLVVWKCLIEIP